MKKFLKIFISLVIIVIVLYQFRTNISTEIKPIWSEAVNRASTYLGTSDAPCAKPITYSIGTFNMKFGISQEYFLSAVSEAKTIWEKALGKELFTYVAGNGTLKINLVYDYRQEATSKLASIGINVKDTKASYDSLKSKFDDLNTQLTADKNNYDTEVSNFNKKQQTYENQVKYWNAQGGAPKTQYDALQIEKNNLDAEVNQLQLAQTHINETIDEINAMVVVLNHLASTLNLSVNQYNSISGTRGESFEEGVYQSDGVNSQIDVYEFSNREKLVRVLAHELGHALGMEHVNDPKAIMYKLNQGNNDIPTEADLTELKTKCAIMSTN